MTQSIILNYIYFERFFSLALPIITNADFLSTKMNPNKMEDENESAQDIYEKYDPLLHGKRKRK